MKKISIVNPCYNEENNIFPMYQAVKAQMEKFPQYDYEHIFIDNCSKDNSESVLRGIAAKDKHVKVFFNLKNFGPDRSGMYAVYQATGDAIIVLPTDFQEPPELIETFINEWAKGNKLVLGQRNKTEANGFMNLIRLLYYKIIKAFSENEELERVTGFGLYDKEIIDWIKWIDSPEPQLRTAVTMLGYKPVLIPYTQQKRASGHSSYNFFSYVRAAMVNLIASSLFPLRFITYLGFFGSVISAVVGLVYLILKLVHWYSFNAGIAPIIIGMSLLGSIQLLALGVIGEYVGSVLTNIKRRPMAISRETLNVEEEKAPKTKKGR